MPIFVYVGPGAGISLGGEQLEHNQPKTLEGRAAAAAAAHPDVRQIKAADAPKAEAKAKAADAPKDAPKDAAKSDGGGDQGTNAAGAGD